MRSEVDPLVTEYQHDVHRHRAADALRTLQKIASLVKPIMRQRNWRVETLCEFLPEQPNLLGLNINRGQKICLRLRYPGDDKQFLPIEEVTDTMLHELCHNVWGPHDENFHNLWNQLRDEHEALVRKGYTGEGFLGAGQKLGGSRIIPRDEAKRRARAAAEKRRTLTAGSGQKVGGRAVQRGEDVRRIIADAAQRRVSITKGCASETEQGNQIARDVERNQDGFRTKAEEDDANERAIMLAYIDLIQEEEKEKYGDSYVPPSESNPAGTRAKTSPPAQSLSSINIPDSTPPIPAHSKPIFSVEDQRGTMPRPMPDEGLDEDLVKDEDDISTWACAICTLINPSQYLACDACGTERPTSSSNIVPKKPPPRSIHDLDNLQQSSTPRQEASNALKPRLNVRDSLRALEEQEKAKPAKPMGWLCHKCSNWMESQWWTCARCGEMKLSS